MDKYDHNQHAPPKSHQRNVKFLWNDETKITRGTFYLRSNFSLIQNSKSPAWTAVISNFLYLIQETLEHVSVQRESSNCKSISDGPLWSPDQKTSHSIITKTTALFKEGNLSKHPRKIKKRCLNKMKLSQSIKSRRGWREDSNNPYAYDFKVVLRSMQATTIWYKKTHFYCSSVSSKAPKNS